MFYNAMSFKIADKFKCVIFDIILYSPEQPMDANTTSLFLYFQH